MTGRSFDSSAGTPTPDLEARTKIAAKALTDRLKFYPRPSTFATGASTGWGATPEELTQIVLAAAGIPALIAEVERLQGELDEAHWTDNAASEFRAEVVRLRAQRQAALDYCGELERLADDYDDDDPEEAEIRERVARFRAALGATE